MFEAFRKNKNFLLNQKKSVIKFSDPTILDPLVETDEIPFSEKTTIKELKEQHSFDPGSISNLKMDLAINTTKLLDSHSDVHFNGLWNKSLKETKGFYLLQEHAMKFDKIITDQVKASAKMMSWKDLGANYEGKTQVLHFAVDVDKERNPFMFEQYAKGYVKNHSVGMRYVKLFLALNSESKWDVEEKEIWDKYIDEVVNKEVAEAQGYFWAVTEAKVIEGSAVPVGSNPVTPTISTEGKGAAESTPATIEAAEEGTSKNSEEERYYKNLI